MEIDAVSFSAENHISSAVSPDKTQSSTDLLFEKLLEVDGKIKEAENQVQLLAVGEAESLHQVMLSISKAKSTFELTTEIRNRLLESFQEVMRMQV